MDLISEVRGGVATVTLNRPAALNALTYEMVLELHARLREWAVDPQVRAVVVRGAGEKAFCAGGDIRALYESFKTKGSLHREFFVVEYELDYFIHQYPKPCIAVMDGITMGGGNGVAQAARIRIATDKTRIAMPEVGIGLIPDVGASYFLSRLPGAIGLYLALTGNQVRAADALYTGLADVYISTDALTGIEDKLREREGRDATLALRSMGVTSMPDPPLAAMRAAIDRHFSHDSVESILASLRSESSPEYSTWAQQTLTTIVSRSPLTVAVALRQLQRGKTLDLAGCFRMELGLVHHCFERGDFIEGVRALIIDKDNRPHWRFDSIASVPDAEVDAIFTDPWADGEHRLRQLR
jgi:enoyl-CoA hydratase/carnithine racemase